MQTQKRHAREGGGGGGDSFLAHLYEYSKDRSVVVNKTVHVAISRVACSVETAVKPQRDL